MPKAKPGELKAQWGKQPDDSPDLCYAWGGTGAQRCDAHLIHQVFTCDRYGFKGYDDREPSFLKELEKRGYDITTFRFSIKQKAKAL